MKDAQSWGALIWDDARNTDVHMRDVYKNGVEDGYRKFRGSGPTIGTNQVQIGTAVSEPLTPE